MTAEEKRSIFNLVKNASALGTGYVEKEFLIEPEFTDDPKAESLKPEEPKTQGVSLETIAKKVDSCKNCILHQKRTHTVLGEGVLTPYVMVIGEGPGEDEDKTGRPFVGKAGQLLDKMLASISLSRTSNCYIANTVKCRPPLNRTPMTDETEACKGFLEAQIHILKPKYILALGRTAAQTLLKTSEGINSLRGKFFDYEGIPLLATYHPSALLRDEALKRPAWQDLKTFREKIATEHPDYASEFFKEQNKA